MEDINFKDTSAYCIQNNFKLSCVTITPVNLVSYLQEKKEDTNSDSTEIIKRKSK